VSGGGLRIERGRGGFERLFGHLHGVHDRPARLLRNGAGFIIFHRFIDIIDDHLFAVRVDGVDQFLRGIGFQFDKADGGGAVVTESGADHH
jgi:hypothetical protein